MVKLTVEILSRNSYINPVGDREIDLRGLKIPAIESLGVVRDQLDSIDLTDNSIRHLTNFPHMPRLKQILLSNNPVMLISPNIGRQLPNLRDLVLVNCDFRELAQLVPLFTLPNLITLSLKGNEVKNKKHYRDLLVFGLRSIRLIDFQKVKDKERTISKSLFQTSTVPPLPTPLYTGLTHQSAQTVIEEEERTFIPGGAEGKIDKGRLLSVEEKDRVKRAVGAATTVEEVRRLQRILDQGIIPSEKDLEALLKRQKGNGSKDVEMDE